MFKEFCTKLLVPQVVRSYRKGYSGKALLDDFLSGITIGTFAIPLAVAFAIAGGLEPSRGFYAAIIGGFFISLLSGSKVQFGGPTGTLAIIIFNIVQKYGYEGLITATLITGVLLIIFGLMRLGSLIKYIPDSITAAYTTAIALMIFTGQLFDFFGLSLKKMPSQFFSKWMLFFSEFSSYQVSTLLVGICSLVFLLYLDRKYPKFPSSIGAIVLFSIITLILPNSIDTVGSRFGDFTRSLPEFNLIFSLQLAPIVFQDAFMMALLISMESILSVVVSDGMTGGKNRPDSELLSQGFANILCSLFGGMPVAGSLSRTVTAIKSGASSPLSGVIHALFIGAFVWLFAPYIKYIPMPTLAAILMLLAWKMCELKRFVKFFSKAPKPDVIVLTVTFALIIFVDIMGGIETGIVLSTALFIKRMSENENAVKLTEIFSESPKSTPDPEAIDKKQVPDKVEVYEINGPFFFGLVERFKDIINKLGPPPKVFILRMRKVSFMDSAALKAISELHDKCLKQNTILLLSGVSGQIRYDLKHMDIEEKIGRDHIFSNVHTALEKAKELIFEAPEDERPLEPQSVEIPEA